MQYVDSWIVQGLGSTVCVGPWFPVSTVVLFAPFLTFLESVSPGNEEFQQTATWLRTYKPRRGCRYNSSRIVQGRWNELISWTRLSSSSSSARCSRGIRWRLHFSALRRSAAACYAASSATSPALLELRADENLLWNILSDAYRPLTMNSERTSEDGMRE